MAAAASPELPMLLSLAIRLLQLGLIWIVLQAKLSMDQAWFLRRGSLMFTLMTTRM
jgi:hypothetical protein